MKKKGERQFNKEKNKQRNEIAGQDTKFGYEKSEWMGQQQAASISTGT